MPSRSHWQRRLNPLLSLYSSLSPSERFAIALIILGAVLRLIFPSVIEYKWDEHLMGALAGKPSSSIDPRSPWLGIASSQGFRNPGLSVWVFVALHRALNLFTDVTPVVLAMGVAGLAVVALLWSTAIALRLKERSLWLWIIALTATQPIEILLTRKIWAQSVLPIFCVSFWWACLRLARMDEARLKKKDAAIQKFGTAFLVPFTGLALGQIHLSGFFLLAATALVFGRRLFAKPFRAPAVWGGLFTGAAVGALPMIPWFIHLKTYFATHAEPYTGGRSLGAFWLTLKHAFSFDLDYSLGSDFELSPWITGGVILLVVLTSGVSFIQSRKKGARFALPGSTSGLFGLITFVYLVICTGIGFEFHPHYLLILFPGACAVLALCAQAVTPRHANQLLSGVATAQLILSIGVLCLLKQNGGAPQGDFGVSYGQQVENIRNRK